MQNAKSTCETDILIGTKIRDARKRCGLTQLELGELTGRSFQQIQKYEKGMNRVSASILYQISKELNCDLLWFFENGDSEAKSAEEVANKELADECSKHIQELKNSKMLPFAAEMLRNLLSMQNEEDEDRFTSPLRGVSKHG